jgi:hypothetical protein
VLICQNYSTEVVYLNILGLETSTLAKHLKSAICSQKAKFSRGRRGGKQLQIKDSIPID